MYCLTCFQRTKAFRIAAKWCQLCRSAWSSMTNCAVTGAPKLSEKGAARSNCSSVNAHTALDASRLFRRSSSSAVVFVSSACSWACLAFSSATASHVTSVTAFPLAIARATSISIGYMLATWCTIRPTERRSVSDTGARHSCSGEPFSKGS